MFVFGDFTKNVRFVQKSLSLDNFVFKLHYRLTFWFILVCAVLVSSRQFIQEHINCITDTKIIRRVINTYCFFSATFTIPKLNNETLVPGKDIVAPGVGHGRSEDDVKFHAYYQWVPFVLFFQAFLFYAPHYIWKYLEGGRVSAIVNNVKTNALTSENDQVINGVSIDSEETTKKKINWLRNVYLSTSRFKINRDWAKYLVLCEFLNTLNILFQIWMVDIFLKGSFINLGVKWLEDDGDQVLESVFPKVTKCIFHKFGSSGSIQTHDALCVMALNIINEKVYTILWFWFLVLLIFTLFGHIWRFLTFILHSKSLSFNRFIWNEISPGPPIKEKDIQTIAEKLSFSDWLFLYYIGKNMEPRIFRNVIVDLCSSLRENSLLYLQLSDKSDLASESSC